MSETHKNLGERGELDEVVKVSWALEAHSLEVVIMILAFSKSNVKSKNLSHAVA